MFWSGLKEAHQIPSSLENRNLVARNGLDSTDSFLPAWFNWWFVQAVRCTGLAHDLGSNPKSLVLTAADRKKNPTQENSCFSNNSSSNKKFLLVSQSSELPTFCFELAMADDYYVQAYEACEFSWLNSKIQTTSANFHFQINLVLNSASNVDNWTSAKPTSKIDVEKTEKKSSRTSALWGSRVQPHRCCFKAWEPPTAPSSYSRGSKFGLNKVSNLAWKKLNKRKQPNWKSWTPLPPKKNCPFVWTKIL